MFMDVLVVLGILFLIVGVGIFGFAGFLAGKKADADREQSLREPTNDDRNEADGNSHV